MIKKYLVSISRAVELLASQVSSNTVDLSSLGNKLEGKVSTHIDVRESLLKIKDQKIAGLVIFFI